MRMKEDRNVERRLRELMEHFRATIGGLGAPPLHRRGTAVYQDQRRISGVRNVQKKHEDQ